MILCVPSSVEALTNTIGNKNEFKGCECENMSIPHTLDIHQKQFIQLLHDRNSRASKIKEEEEEEEKGGEEVEENGSSFVWLKVFKQF